MSKYIIFKTETASDNGWEDRKLAHTGALTDILAEHFDSSNRPLPAPGYRLREYHSIPRFEDKQFPGASTHSRLGDWEVTRVEQYPTGGDRTEFEEVVICYCRYAPISSPLEPLPRIQEPTPATAGTFKRGIDG